MPLAELIQRIPSPKHRSHLVRMATGILLPSLIAPYSLCLVYPQLFPYLLSITFATAVLAGFGGLLVSGVLLFLRKFCFLGGILISASVLYVLAMLGLSEIIAPHVHNGFEDFALVNQQIFAACVILYISILVGPNPEPAS